MKKSKKNDGKETFHVLMYVVDSTPKLKKFSNTKALGKFIDEFNKKYPEADAGQSGYWTDFAVTGITGDVHFFTDGIELE